jgi:endonuclease-3
VKRAAPRRPQAGGARRSVAAGRRPKPAPPSSPRPARKPAQKPSPARPGAANRASPPQAGRAARRPARRDAGLAERAREIVARLERAYPEARCSLNHADAFQLLVATILSAQCTDARVNLVTPELFRRWPDARALAGADLDELEDVIRSTGFFHNKAKNILACSRQLLMQHGGRVPADLDALVALPGIGRKTANVVLGNAFGIPGVVVDTHVGRLSQRLGLTSQQDPNKIELDLMQVVPRDKWTPLAHLLIEHGRAVCQARLPRCAACALNDLCPASLV